jgi:molybdenum cofactor cytidylyltransferase
MTSAILLAAGESTRMGRPKPLLPWGETTLLEYQLAELRAMGKDGVK